VGTSDSFTPAAKKMEGCYLYFDREEAEWIWSGKVADERLLNVTRSTRRALNSNVKYHGSRFYTRYQARAAAPAPVRSRRILCDLTILWVSIWRGSPSCTTWDDENGICWDKDCLVVYSKQNPWFDLPCERQEAAHGLRYVN
jgi:hypothetical protein